MGERRDRHATLGTGNIGIDNMLIMYDLFAKHGIPMILKPPQTNIRMRSNYY